MRKVILQQSVTIDGFAAGPNGEMDFHQDYAAKNDKSYQDDALQFLDTIDTMILGANTYRIFVDYWPYAAGEVEVFSNKLNSLSKYVASTTLENAPWGKWEGAKIISNPAEEIVRLKQQPGKDIVIWGSITLSQSLMKDGLIDECQLRICPVTLGSGQRLFIDDTPMELLEAKAYDKGLVLLRYESKER